MDKMTVEQLESEATSIVLQEWHTPDDCKQLSQIKYFLSLHYKRINIDWSAKEKLYNEKRSWDSVELQESMAVNKAENIAKSYAETSYGGYRSINAEAQWISKTFEAISGFIIAIQVELKSLNSVQY